MLGIHSPVLSGLTSINHGENATLWVVGPGRYTRKENKPALPRVPSILSPVHNNSRHCMLLTN